MGFIPQSRALKSIVLGWILYVEIKFLIGEPNSVIIVTKIIDLFIASFFQI